MPSTDGRAARARQLLGVALLSAAGLGLEIALTRVLSVSYFHSHVYLLLSIAVLGIGVGAALASWRPFWRMPRRLPLWAALAGVSALVVTAASVSGTLAALRFLPFLATTLPYLFLGLALATVFSSRAGDSPRLYWADLSGAGLGALVSVPLLNALGGPGAMLAAALAFPVAGILFLTPPARSGRTAAVVVTACLVAVALAGHLGLGWLALEPERLASAKPLRAQMRAGAQLVATNWNAFARTDLVYRPDQGAHYLYVDGAAGSLVPAAADAALWRRDIGNFPFVADSPDSVLIIGPGGGLDVALARAAGTREITAVEINRASVALVRGLGQVTGDVYGEGVTILYDEGRSALRRMARRFELIFLSQVVTQAAEARGYALTENGLYTVEAFHDYLDHLTGNGQVALKLYDELTLTRALTTAVTALRERGLTDAQAAGHLVALLDTRASPPVPLLLVRRQPLAQAEAVRLARTAEGLGLALLYVPGLLAQGPLADLASGRKSLESIVAASPEADIRPTTDAWPFFYQFEPGLPDGLRSLLAGMAGLLLAGLATLIVRQRGEAAPFARWSPLLFAALGFGFMVTEVSLLQRTQLFLGHPTLALGVVLGTLLIGGGAGSLLTRSVAESRAPSLLAPCGLLVAGLLASWTLVWPELSSLLQGGSPLARTAAVIGSLGPLAVLMGMPFPLALRALGSHGPSQVALAWAVNGVMSVAGGVGATVVAMLFSYDGVALAGGVAYLLVAASGLTLGGRVARHRRVLRS